MKINEEFQVNELSLGRRTNLEIILKVPFASASGSSTLSLASLLSFL